MSLFNKRNLEQQEILRDWHIFNDFASLYPSTFNNPTRTTQYYWPTGNIYDKNDYWKITDEVTDEQVNK